MQDARAAGQAELVTPLEIGLLEGNRWRPLRLPQLARLDDVTDFRIERDTLWIKTLPGWEETFIMLPIDLDHQEELIMCESISD